MDQRLRYLNALRHFESAARHQSFTRAAEELCLSQAAVSQQLRQLESALGTKLFVRQGRQMLLTQSGETLFTASHQAFDTLLGAFDDIQSEALEGSLTISCPQAFSSLWLMPRLFKFSSQHPDIKIQFSGDNQLQALQTGHSDLVIHFGEPPRVGVSDTLAYEHLGEEKVFPVCSPRVADEMQLATPRDILNCWLVSQSGPDSSQWPAWFEAAGVDNHHLHNLWTEVSSGDMALSAVLSGHGCALAPESLFGQYVRAGQLVVPFAICHPKPLKRYLVFNTHSAKRKRLAVFSDWLKSEMAHQTAT